MRGERHAQAASYCYRRRRPGSDGLFLQKGLRLQGGGPAELGARRRRLPERRHAQHGDPQIQDRPARQGSRLSRDPSFRRFSRGCRRILQKARDAWRRLLHRPQPERAERRLFRKEILWPGARAFRYRGASLGRVRAASRRDQRGSRIIRNRQRKTSMAKLRHIAIAAKDPDAMADFYVKAFDFKIVRSNDGPLAYGHHLSDGTIDLAILRFKTDQLGRGMDYTGLHHFGILVEDVAAAAKAVEA